MLKHVEVRDISVSFSLKQNEIINQRIDEFVKCMLDERQSVSYYKLNRNADYTQKAAEDIFVGKKAECFAMYGLRREYNFPFLKIDIEVRTGKRKGWRSDLPFSQIDTTFPNVHVKACTARTFRYCNDFSWTFQYNNKEGSGGRDKLFQGGYNDWIVLVFMENTRSTEGVIKAILPWNVLKYYLKDPKKENLVGIKKCIYYKDLL